MFTSVGKVLILDLEIYYLYIYIYIYNVHVQHYSMHDCFRKVEAKKLMSI